MTEIAPTYTPQSSPPAPPAAADLCNCGAPGVYLSRSTDARLCVDHGRAELLGGWCAQPGCQLGIVITEFGEIEACVDCAALGAGFGSIDGPDPQAAARHLRRILAALEPLGALRLDPERVRAAMRALAGLTFTQGVAP